ncbi:hypothetical protein Tco_0227640 [Tanacetum coccineum]
MNHKVVGVIHKERKKARINLNTGVKGRVNILLVKGVIGDETERRNKNKSKADHSNILEADVCSSSGSRIQSHGLRSNLGNNKCGSYIGALYPASQKEKVAVSSLDSGIQSYGSCSNLGDNRCGDSIGAYCVSNVGSDNDWGFNSDPTSQKEKVAHPYFDSCYGSFVADVGSQPYGLCGSFVNDGSKLYRGLFSSVLVLLLNGPVRGIVLDFDNSKVRLPSAGVCFLWNWILVEGGWHLILRTLSFLSSVEKDLGRPVMLDDGVWFRSSAVNGSFHDDHYDCFFRQS